MDGKTGQEKRVNGSVLDFLEDTRVLRHTHTD
jgi:hypothetical protein